MSNKSSLIIIITAFVFLGCNNSKKAPEIPIEDFFRNPEKTYYKISPNGQYISYQAPYNNRMNLLIEDINTQSTKQITFEEDRSIGGYIWANDTRILYVKDEGGNEDFKLYGVNIDGSDQKCLTCYEGVRVQLIDDLIDSPDEIIIGLNLRDSTVFDPYRLNIVTGKLKNLAINPGNIINWMTDHDGKLRLATAVYGGVNQVILYRDKEEDAFRPVLKTTWKDDFRPQFFTFDNRMIYALSNIGRDKIEVVVFDPKSKSETQVLYKNPEVDITKLKYSRKRQKLTTAHFTTHKKQEYFFDEFAKDHYEIVKSKLPDYDIWVTSMSRNEDMYIVEAFNDKSRGTYYLYNSHDETLRLISTASPWLNAQHLASMEPVSFVSRDGLTIHGYLTLPKGVNPKNLPVIINPHGGPWTRNYWGYNPEVQFFANRGYAVLQLNFRGSTGYGKEFWLKSVKQWGKAMQNDITDGTKWLIDKGIADKNKIAIYGSSWGGYAALCGVTFTPDLYTCGIDYVGPSNLFSFMQTLPPYWEPMREMFYELVGHPENDSLLLAEISPALHVDQVKVPLLIAQGANDPRVNIQESDQIVEALRQQNVEVEYIVKQNEGHGFKNEENRFALYRAIEEFLNKNLHESE
jgi:dipeptidyl aminopeptidase/acylaminoacyl peptidase